MERTITKLLKNKKVLLALVLMMTVSFGASAIVFEKPASNVYFEKNGDNFSVSWQGEFITVTVDNLMDYDDCLWCYSNYTYYELLKKFSTKINEDTRSLDIDAVELFK